MRFNTNKENSTDMQCIADMKSECDAHGLEYEIIMQEAAKARFLRQVKKEGFDLNDFSKHLVVLKQKRASNSSDPVVAAAGPVVQPAETSDRKLGDF